MQKSIFQLTFHGTQPSNVLKFGTEKSKCGSKIITMAYYELFFTDRFL